MLTTPNHSLGGEHFQDPPNPENDADPAALPPIDEEDPAELDDPIDDWTGESKSWSAKDREQLDSSWSTLVYFEWRSMSMMSTQDWFARLDLSGHRSYVVIPANLDTQWPFTVVSRVDPANPEASTWNCIRDLLISGLPEEGGSPPTTITIEAPSPVAIAALRAGLEGCCDAEEDSGYGVRLRWENLLDAVRTPPQGLLDSIGDQFETSSLTEENKQKILDAYLTQVGALPPPSSPLVERTVR